MEHDGRLQRTGHGDYRYACTCGYRTPWVRTIAQAGVALVKHVAHSERKQHELPVPQ